jgi:hypothetical protein
MNPQMMIRGEHGDDIRADEQRYADVIRERCVRPVRAVLRSEDLSYRSARNHAI